VQLLHDFVFQVPRKDHDIIGLGLPDTIGMEDWNVAARQKAALLIRTAVYM